MKTLYLLLMALLLGACATPYRPPQLVDAGTAYPGLIDLAAQAGTADVLLVHGICTHDAAWAEQVVAQLMRSVDAATSSPSAARVDGGPQVRIVSSMVETPAGRLRFNALIWSPLTTGLKRQLCYDQSNKSELCTGAPPYPYIRAGLNARFKDGLIDDCLPDALIYQGVARDEIQRRMRDAILQVLATSDGAETPSPLVVISHSMGSKILFDTLLRMSEEAPGSRAALMAQRAVDRMRFLVMAANQIPLLSLADQQVTSAGLAPAAPDSLQLLLQKRLASNERRADRHLTLVAFTDPNDLLSYTLPPEKYARDGIAVYNILVSNATTYLGLLERPDYAHLDYLTNPDVGHLIVCGQPTSSLCKRE